MDNQGNPLVRLEWKVTDNADPTQVKCELLVNGQPLAPATYGMLATGCTDISYAGDFNEYDDYIPNYSPLLAGFENVEGFIPDQQSFILTLSGTANGMVNAVLRAPGVGTMAVNTPVLTGGNVCSPAQLLFNCGAGDDAGGGGDIRLHYRATGTLNYVTDGLLAVNAAFYGTANRPISVSAPGLLQDAVDIDGSGACALVTQAAHGAVVLNADGSFTYTPNTGFYGTDSFSYQISTGTHVSNTATVTLQVATANQIDLRPAWTSRHQ